MQEGSPRFLLGACASLVHGGGGCQPVWRRDGKELFYLTPDGKLMVASVNGGNPPQMGVPMLLFQTPAQVSPTRSQYWITGDGKNFLLLEPVGERSAELLNIVLNWTAGLKR